MHIFVTGGTGFIGSHFIDAALRAGHEVTAIRRVATARLPLLLEAEPRWLERGLAEIGAGDLEGCEVVAHFAACGVTPQPCDWDSAFRVNVMDSLALMATARASGVMKVVASGTYAEYGKAGLRYEFIPPDAPLEPTDPYAASKAAASVALGSYARANRMGLFYGRIFSAFGEGQNAANFWPALRRAALAGEDFEMTAGEQVRDFIPVTDVAAQFLAACTKTDWPPGEPEFRNVASGRPVTLAGFATEWWEKWEAVGQLRLGAVPYRPNEVMRYIAKI